MTELRVERLGLTNYGEALEYQERLVEERKKNLIPDTLLLLRHPNVITLGRKQSERFLRHTALELAELGYPVIQAGRGGEVTFHGPGQLIAYPIIKLKESERDLHKYLRNLEKVTIGVCAELGLETGRIEGRTGVWLEGKKLAAIGVRARSWVTFHGLALNRTAELEGFDLIVPCGISDAGVTCLEAHLVELPYQQHLETLFTQVFCQVFQRAAEE